MANLATRIRFTQPQPDLDDLPGLKRLSAPSIGYDDDYDDFYSDPFRFGSSSDWSDADYGYDETYFEPASKADEEYYDDYDYDYRYYESPCSYSDFDFTWGDYGLPINENSCVHGGSTESCVACDMESFIAATAVLEDEAESWFDTAEADSHAADKDRRERRRMSTIRHHRRRLNAAMRSRQPSTKAFAWQLKHTGADRDHVEVKPWQLHCRKIQCDLIDRRDHADVAWELKVAAEDLLAA